MNTRRLAILLLFSWQLIPSLGPLKAETSGSHLLGAAGLLDDKLVENLPERTINEKEPPATAGLALRERRPTESNNPEKTLRSFYCLKVPN